MTPAQILKSLVWIQDELDNKTQDKMKLIPPAPVTVTVSLVIEVPNPRFLHQIHSAVRVFFFYTSSGA